MRPHFASATFFAKKLGLVEEDDLALWIETVASAARLLSRSGDDGSPQEAQAPANLFQRLYHIDCRCRSATTHLSLLRLRESPVARAPLCIVNLCAC
jgi:hypothetical protein